ncbi:hypothetical protein CF8_0188 [Aeromonas phage CF8]|nr:hypothetical protein CF8_0188 [Aeromonas phage CF8]
MKWLILLYLAFNLVMGFWFYSIFKSKDTKVPKRRTFKEG